MTKKDFARTIYETVENSQFFDESPKEIISKIEILLSAVRPNDYEKFSAWGLPGERTTPERCWAE